jgi:hypothetical protein
MRGSQKIRFPILLPPNNLTKGDASLFTYYSLHFTVQGAIYEGREKIRFPILLPPNNFT